MQQYSVSILDKVRYKSKLSQSIRQITAVWKSVELTFLVQNTSVVSVQYILSVGLWLTHV